MKLKIDLHVHTTYSPDSLITPDELVFFAKKRGLNGVAVTDHDRLDGALKISEETRFFVVPGMEISSLNGHIIGLDVQEMIPKGLTAEETVDRIHRACGIAVACHPMTLFKGSLGNHTSSKFDAVETINSSAVPFSYSVMQSEKLASRLGIARVAGSDAHFGPEIGSAYTIVDAEANVEEVLKAIRNCACRPFGKSIPLGLRLKREVSVVLKRFRAEKTRIETTDNGANENLSHVPGRPCVRI